MSSAKPPVDTSTDRNPASVEGQGEFHARVGRSAPMTTKGHKPGVLASEKDRAPEFHAKTLPPGSAPEENTFRPNPTGDVPPVANYADDNKIDDDAETTSAADTLGGASSADVHTGLGHPGAGMTSQEIRHDGQHGGKRERQGLVGVGASGVGNASKLVDPHDPEHADQRAQDKEEVKDVVPNRGNVGGAPAEERVPESSESAAAEMPGGARPSGVAGEGR